MTTIKLRIPARVFDHLEGSQAACTPESDPEMAAVLAKLRAANRRKDGSRLITLSDAEEVDTLLIYVEAMAAGAADNAYDPDGLADLNSARAVLRAIARESQ